MRTSFVSVLALMCFLSLPLFAEGAKTKFAVKDDHHAAAHNLAPELSLEELKAWVDGKKGAVTIIDANGADTYKAGHIPGAVSFEKNSSNLAAILPKDKNQMVIAYCGGPLCTAWQAPAAEAKKLGYTNIRHYKGGIKGWKEAKLPTKQG